MKKNKNLQLLKFFLFVYYANWTFIFFFIPVYLKEVKGFSIGMVGILSSLFAFFGAISQVFVGYLSDRLRKRKPFMFLSSFILFFIYFLAFPKLTSYYSFLFLYPLIGILMNTLTNLSNVLALDYSSVEGTGKSFASVRMWAPFGFLTMMTIIGFYPKLTEEQIMFPLIGMIFIISLFIILLLDEPQFKAGVRRIEIRDIRRIITNIRVRNFLIFYMIYTFAMGSAAGNVNFLVKHLGGTNSYISLALIVCALPEIPATLFWGYLADKIGRVPLILFSAIVLPIRVFLYSLAMKPLDVVLIQLFTHIFTFAIMITVSVVYINDLIPEEERASAQGLLSMSGAISQTLASLISGNLADIFGLKGMYLLMTPIALIATLLAFTLVGNNRIIKAKA